MFGLLLAASHYTFQSQAQLELDVSGNNTGMGIGGTGPAATLLVTPSFALTGTFRRWAFELTYVPVVSLETYETPTAAGSSTSTWASPLLGTLQQVVGNVSLRGRGYRLSVNEQASYGRTTYATTLAAAPTTTPPPAQSVPVNSILLTGSTRTTLDLSRQFDRRSEGYFYAGYSLFTGLDASTRDQLPSQQGPIAGFRISTRLARLDSLDTRVDFTRIEFGPTPCTSAVSSSVSTTTTAATLGCSPVDNLTIASVGVRHQFTQATEGTVQVGPAVAAVTSTEGASYSAHFYPTALASIRRTTTYEHAQHQIQASVQVVPLITAQTGTVDERLMGAFSFDRVGQRLLLHGSFTASESLPFDINGAYFLSRVEGSVGWRLRVPFLTASFGLRFDAQRYIVPATTTTGAVLSPEGTITAVLAVVRFTAASRVLGF